MTFSRSTIGLGALVAVCLASCGGPATTPVSKSASTQGKWQLILGIKTSAVSYGIAGVVLDGQGNLYLTEMDDDLIYKYSLSGELLAHWGGAGAGPGEFTSPNKVALDKQGNLYVTEVGLVTADGSAGENNRIQKFSPTGKPLAQWGTLGSGPGQFNTPVGLAVDKQGNIYVSDMGNHRIQKLSALGQLLAQWHSVGTGTGTVNTEIAYDLALDASGNVYITEPHPHGPGNDRIEKFSPTGERLAHWGGSGTGPGQFYQPYGLAVDSRGNVFVVDTGNNRLQELSSAGDYVAQWMGPQGGFLHTSAVAVDDHGNIYVSVGSQILKLVRT